MNIISDSPEKTKQIAEAIGKLIPPETVLSLSGPLGVGKTTFAQGLARGLGVADRVTSPTFVLAQCYEDGRLPLAHLDAYRLENADLYGLGLEEYWQHEGVTVIEWAENLTAILPPHALHISILPQDGAEAPERRIMSFACASDEYPWLEEALQCVF